MILHHREPVHFAVFQKRTRPSMQNDRMWLRRWPHGRPWGVTRATADSTGSCGLQWGGVGQGQQGFCGVVACWLSEDPSAPRLPEARARGICGLAVPAGGNYNLQGLVVAMMALVLGWEGAWIRPIHRVRIFARNQGSSTWGIPCISRKIQRTCLGRIPLISRFLLCRCGHTDEDADADVR